MIFSEKELKELWRPRENSSGDENGVITIIGGSELFQGAPLMSLMAASRLVDTVFLATPESDKGILEKAELFCRVRALIWVPREEMEAYIKKSDAVLIGPGMMRFRRESARVEYRGAEVDGAGKYTRDLTARMFKNFAEKRWVIDGGSLQTMQPDIIPKKAIVTPNQKEFEMLFGTELSVEEVERNAKKYQCVVVGKGRVTWVSDGETTYELEGGNAGLTKGGTGDVLAGVIVGLAAKNEPLLAAAAGVFLVKRTAERLFERYGYGYSADDLAREVFATKRAVVGY